MYLRFPVFYRIIRLTFSRKFFSLRHALLTVLFLVLFFILRTFVWVVRWLDYLFFPRFRQQPVKAPIYIIGNPRSGTTFTHRLVSRDSRFCYLQLFHTIFPAITFYRFFDAAGRLDRRLGHPFARLLNAASQRGFQGWSAIHKTGPKDAESDEMFFMYAMLSPLLALLFPFLDQLEEVRFVDRLPAESKRKLMTYYKDCLKRHLYANGPDKILLEKVALIAGRLGSILELFPDMRIIYLVRHPYESIPSLISMFRIPWKSLAPQALKDNAATEGVAQMIFDYYRYILRLKNSLPSGQFVEVRYTDLVTDPRSCIEGIYRDLGLEVSDEFRQVLIAETEIARQYKSRHRYSLEEFGLSKERVYQELQEVFEEYGFER
jgi:hypothetical protein